MSFYLQIRSELCRRMSFAVWSAGFVHLCFHKHSLAFLFTIQPGGTWLCELEIGVHVPAQPLNAYSMPRMTHASCESRKVNKWLTYRSDGVGESSEINEIGIRARVVCRCIANEHWRSRKCRKKMRRNVNWYAIVCIIYSNFRCFVFFLSLAARRKVDTRIVHLFIGRHTIHAYVYTDYHVSSQVRVRVQRTLFFLSFLCFLLIRTNCNFIFRPNVFTINPHRSSLKFGRRKMN